jgi:hypothetical protein
MAPVAAERCTPTTIPIVAAKIATYEQVEPEGHKQANPPVRCPILVEPVQSLGRLSCPEFSPVSGASSKAHAVETRFRPPIAGALSQSSDEWSKTRRAQVPELLYSHDVLGCLFLLFA